MKCKFCGASSSPRWNGQECWGCQKARIAAWKKANRGKKPSTITTERDRERARKWAAEHPEENKAKARAWYAEHGAERNAKLREETAQNRPPPKTTEEIKAQNSARTKRWRAEHPEEVRAHSRAAAKKRRDSRKAAGLCTQCGKAPIYKGDRCEPHYRAHTETESKANRPSKKAYSAAWKKANAALVVLYTERRRARKQAAEGFWTASQWAQIYARQNHRCIDCGRAVPLTVGHAVPITRGGSNWPENIIGQCRQCNSRQGTKIHPTALLALAA